MKIDHQTRHEGRVNQLLYKLGKTYLERSQFAEAHNKFSQLIEIEPEEPEVYCCLTSAAIGLRDTSPEALQIYEKTLRLNPDSVQIALDLATLFTQKKITTEFAVEVREQAVKSSPPGAAGIHEHLRQYYDKPGLNEKAKTEEYKTAVTGYRLDEIQAYLENLWWEGSFSEANRILQEVERGSNNDKNYKKQKALTYAYEALAQKRTLKDKNSGSIVYSCLQEFPPDNGIDDLRNYLTLRLSLSDSLKFSSDNQQEHDEYNFILGLIPVTDFLSKAGQRELNRERKLGKFSLSKEILDILEKADGWKEQEEDTSLKWQGVLFLQLKTKNDESIPGRVLKLVSSHLFKIPNSIFRSSKTGFLSLATEPALQVKAAAKLMQSLDDYNTRVPGLAKIITHCGLVLLPGYSQNEHRKLLKALVNTAHLLHYVNRLSENSEPASKFLIQADENQLQKIDLNGYSLGPIKEVAILPGQKTPCTEVIWRNPLAHITDAQGYSFGKIEIKKQLAEHQTYKTYLSADRQLGRRIILKSMSLKNSMHYIRSEDELNNLYETIRRPGRLSHPNIATLFDMGMEDNLIYFTREYVEGRPLTEAPFADDEWEYELCMALMKIVRALIYAHQQGVVHLNLKPQNIWLDGGQGIKITDFRIPGFSDTGGDSEMQWKYTAPEMVTNKTGDTRSDIFSLGILSYQAVTGQHPYDVFGIEKPSDLFNTKIESIISTDRPHNQAWDAFLLKAIAPEPQNRFQSHQEVEVELRKILTEVLPKV